MFGRAPKESNGKWGLSESYCTRSVRVILSLLSAGTFDDDDMTAFLKANVSLTLSTLATVLEKHGIETGGLRMIVQRMEINNVSTNGGSIIGAAIGGIANRIAAEVRT